MTTLTAHGVLQTWEQARHGHPLRRSLALLCAAWPQVDAGDWGAMPVGVRDAWLLRLQEALFGPELDTVAPCPACDELLQTRFTTADLQTATCDTATAASLTCEGYDLDYRLPCHDDLLAIAGVAHDSPAAASRRLLERCLLAAHRAGEPTAVDELPVPVLDRLQQSMAEADPGADMRVALVCPACGHRFERRVDIDAYLWDALDDWAQRTLAEVHLLASAYGWSEPQILALSAARRGHYIALVQS